jgi:hypothetical protein
MRQRPTLVGKQENEIAGLSLSFAQLEPQTDTIDLVRDFAPLQRVPRSPETESPFLRNTLESCEREIETFSRAAISFKRTFIVSDKRSLRQDGQVSSSFGPPPAVTKVARRLSARPAPSAALVQEQRSPSAHQSRRA